MRDWCNRLRRACAWWLRQWLASPGVYYGRDGTIHGTTHLDVETHDGKVVAVWFRCRTLPFEQFDVDPDRAKSMQAAYRDFPPARLLGVDVTQSS